MISSCVLCVQAKCFRRLERQSFQNWRFQKQIIRLNPGAPSLALITPHEAAFTGFQTLPFHYLLRSATVHDQFLSQVFQGDVTPFKVLLLVARVLASKKSLSIDGLRIQYLRALVGECSPSKQHGWCNENMTCNWQIGSQYGDKHLMFEYAAELTLVKIPYRILMWFQYSKFRIHNHIQKRRNNNGCVHSYFCAGSNIVKVKQAGFKTSESRRLVFTYFFVGQEKIGCEKALDYSLHLLNLTRTKIISQCYVLKGILLG